MLGLLITYESAGVGELESARLDEPLEFIKRLMDRDEINECLALQTCNRVELYGVASDAQRGEKALLEFAKENMDLDVDDYAEFLTGSELLEHLLRMAGGIESMIVGEDQILGQIEEAYELHRENGYTGKILNTAFEEAIKVGKLIRTETNINVGHISVGSAAVGLAEDLLGDLENKDVLIIGAGETAELVGQALVKRHPSPITVANRTYEKGEELAEKLGGNVIRFSNFSRVLPSSDVVISATSAPHIILEKGDLEELIPASKNLLIIDIANPKDVSKNVAEIKNVKLYDMDSLKRIADRNRKKRKREAVKAESIIGRELQRLLQEYGKMEGKGIVGEIHRMAEKIRVREVGRAIDRLQKTMGEVDGEEREILNDLTKGLVRKILHDPVLRIKEASMRGEEAFLTSAKELFNLREDEYSRQCTGGDKHARSE